MPGAPGTGQRLCVYHSPSTDATQGVRAAVLHVHPWAEEMNKSRRMAAMQSRALAAAGHAVLQIDLHGCGDSSGDFGNATWQGWVDDLVRAAHWLQQRHPKAALWLWGHRAGALLAVQAAAQLQAVCHFVFWQPATVGKPLLQQFLRLAAAAELQQGGAKGAVDKLRGELAAGRSVDVAGYTVPASLAAGLDAALLELPAHTGHVAWLEVSSREPAALLPASALRLQAWRDGGREIDAQVVAGPSFWQTQEIEDAPALCAATVAAVGRAGPGVPV